MGKKRRPQRNKKKPHNNQAQPTNEPENAQLNELAANVSENEMDPPNEGRSFEQLDAHGVQEALKEELAADEETIISPDSPPSEDNLELVAVETLRTFDEGAVEEQDPEEAEIEDIDPDAGKGVDEEDILVWTAVQMAEHVRMAEALLFAALEPLDENSISERLPEGADVPAILETLKAQYDNRGVNLSRIAKKWRFVTAADVAPILEKEKIEQRKLSRAALETLAIIAYHQPCTRADIEDVRGVAVSRGSLDQLMEIGWVRLRGRRKNVPGRPVLYGTSQPFMEHFGLESLGDLPGMADLKAAGLLDARLPPGFKIPTPRDSEDGDDEEVNDEMDTEFAQDFMGEADFSEETPTNPSGTEH